MSYPELKLSIVCDSMDESNGTSFMTEERVLTESSLKKGIQRSLSVEEPREVEVEKFRGGYL